MRILFISSEAYPLAKTGGLADVSYALPVALKRLGADVRILIPGYPQAIERLERRQARIPLGTIFGQKGVGLIRGFLPGTDVPVWLIDCAALYRRKGGIYGDHMGKDWHDNHLRYALLSYIGAMIGTAQSPLGWQPDVVHANDWHSGLAPFFSRHFKKRPPPTLFTIHNMAFQGIFPRADLAYLSASGKPNGLEDLEFYGSLSFMKAGILYADRLSTVSPTYAREIITPEYGLGLEGLLSLRHHDLCGILNGVDYEIWDPGSDANIPARYNIKDISGKRICKTDLQESMGLDKSPELPVFGYMSRLTSQKMADLVLEAAPIIAERLGQLVVVAEGCPQFEDAFTALAAQYPGRIAVKIGYDEGNAHRLLAGADILLAPARFEPCGLTQLYAMRYGALPIARRTGGLADTVIDCAGSTSSARLGTGFLFDEANYASLMAAIEHAAKLYAQPLAWRRLRENAMAQDYSWSRSANDYLSLYRAMAFIEELPALENATPLAEPEQLTA